MMDSKMAVMKRKMVAATRMPSPFFPTLSHPQGSTDSVTGAWELVTRSVAEVDFRTAV